MSFKARDSSGQARHAFTVARAQGPFSCQVCGGEMAFVDSNIRAKHFRHRVESNCAWEPETPEHESAKLAVCDAINALGLGTAEVEVPVGQWIADVLWTHGSHRVAFEVQRTNYAWAKFNEKLEGYRELGVAVVYLFIGPQFFRKDDEDYRLKDIELRLLSGREERRNKPYWHGNRASLMEIHRVRPENLGAVAGAYLRRKRRETDELLVREPVFYPVQTKAGRPSLTRVMEAGKAVTALPVYLRAVHDAFLARTGMIFLDGVWYSRLAEALWGHFFSALGMSYRYHPDSAGRPAHFEFRGRYHLVAWVGTGRRPHVPDDSHELRLAESPTLGRDFLFVGWVSDDHNMDEAVLSCFCRDTPVPVVDFGQFNNNYSGAISGLHDGGAPGGDLGSEIAEQAYDLWLDGEARLARGFRLPLCPPRFEGINGFPKLRLDSLGLSKGSRGSPGFTIRPAGT